jgi:flagellar hook assembly protein FlgD
MPLVITNVSTMGGAATRGVGGGVSIVYTLTGAADDVQITVAALNGNVVHRASRGRAEAGVVRAHFNGRSQDGAPIPPGPYTLTITARGANGETAQTKRVLMLLQ